METNKFETVLKQVWKKVFKMIKLITGDVDYKNKGTLQEQINSKKLLNSTVATEAGKFAADAVQLNKEVEGSYAAGVAAEISLINADLLHRIPKTILLACKGRYLCTPGAMDSFNYFECNYSPKEINGRHYFGISKSYSIDYEPAGNYDSGIIVSKNVEDFTGYNAIVIKGYITSDTYTNGENLTVRAYCLIGEATGMDNGVPYDYSSWVLLAETDTEKSFEAYIDISGTGKKKVSFGLYHGDEYIYGTVFLRISEITLIPVM